MFDGTGEPARWLCGAVSERQSGVDGNGFRQPEFDSGCGGLIETAGISENGVQADCAAPDSGRPYALCAIRRVLVVVLRRSRGQRYGVLRSRNGSGGARRTRTAAAHVPDAGGRPEREQLIFNDAATNAIYTLSLHEL